MGGLDWRLGFITERCRDGASGHEKLLREILTLQGNVPVHIKPTQSLKKMGPGASLTL